MEKVKLSEVCEILDSKRIPITASDRKKGIYPYYGANGIQDYVDDYIFDDELVLLAEDGGNFGSKEKPIAYRVSGKCWVNNHAHVLKPLANIDVDYLCYALMFYDVSSMINGATRKKLTQAEMVKMIIPLRSMEEQVRISKALKMVECSISLYKSQIIDLDKLVKSRFIEMFGDLVHNSNGLEENCLCELADIVSGITKGRKTKETEFVEVPYMAVSNVKDGYIDWTTVKTILATKSEIEQYRLQPNDILMTEGGDPDKLGRGSIIKTPLENCIHQNHIFRVRLNQKVVSPVYFSYFLKNPKAKRYFLNCAKQTTGIASINMTQLKSLPVIIPPLSIQNQFADFVAQVDKSKLAVQQSLNELETLKKSLMQQYFG